MALYYYKTECHGISKLAQKTIIDFPKINSKVYLQKFEPADELDKKCELLAQLINTSKHVVVHTGAGISTSAGIPDFRYLIKYFYQLQLASFGLPTIIISFVCYWILDIS